jgi:hypothetical protein
MIRRIKRRLRQAKETWERKRKRGTVTAERAELRKLVITRCQIMMRETK